MNFSLFMRNFSTIARFLTMRYNIVMAEQYFTEEQLKTLPSDILISMILTLQNNQIEMKRSIDQLTEQIRLMNQRQYGRKTEKKSELYEQLQLDLVFNEAEGTVDEGTEPEPEIEKVVVRKRPKGKKEDSLKKITNHRDEYIELPDEELKEKYGENGWKRLPDQIITKLEHIPASFEVVTYHIAVYAPKKDDSDQTIIRAPKPAELWENSIATPTLVASIITAKYRNAMPLYRQEQAYKANDVDISRRTMASWIIRSYDRYLKYVWDAMKTQLLKQTILHADETPFEVNKDGRSAGSKSYMWVYCGGVEENTPPIVLYDYCHTRGTDNARKFLEGYSGTLITDGYQVYHKLANDEPDRFTVAGCWEHAKRKFTEILKSNGKDKGTYSYTIASRAEKKIQRIYHEDNKLKDLSAEERTQARQKKIQPLVDEFFDFIKKTESTGKLASESATGKAIRYALNQEEFLRVFLKDGRLPLDNNEAERKIRGFTIGRKNWVMIDTKSGAEASAGIYSIVETAKMNNLKIYDYLAYLLTELSKTMQDLNTEIPERLLPWSEELPDHVRKPNNTL